MLYGLARSPSGVEKLSSAEPEELGSFARHEIEVGIKRLIWEVCQLQELGQHSTSMRLSVASPRCAAKSRERCIDVSQAEFNLSAELEVSSRACVVERSKEPSCFRGSLEGFKLCARDEERIEVRSADGGKLAVSRGRFAREPDDMSAVPGTEEANIIWIHLREELQMFPSLGESILPDQHLSQPDTPIEASLMVWGDVYRVLHGLQLAMQIAPSTLVPGFFVVDPQQGRILGFCLFKIAIPERWLVREVMKLCDLDKERG